MALQESPPSLSLDSQFLQKTLDSLPSHIAVLDETGCILNVNASWRRFAEENGLAEKYCRPGVSYLQTCDSASGDCSEEASVMAAGIRQILHGERERFYWEYPCHSPSQQRWFSVRVTRFSFAGSACVVVSHDDITPRKLAELEVQTANRKLAIMANTDGLTEIANRRHFDAFLKATWQQHRQDGLPLSLALVDIDCFKQYNDHHGHAAGDDCLKAVAKALAAGLTRDSQLVSRFGGEEFAIILPDTDAAEGTALLTQLQDCIRALVIPHPHSLVPHGLVTVSMGGGTFWPCYAVPLENCLKTVDDALYRSKSEGRDCLHFVERS